MSCRSTCQIDRSFVSLAYRRLHRVMIEATIRMADAGADTVAEGIETEASPC